MIDYNFCTMIHRCCICGGQLGKSDLLDRGVHKSTQHCIEVLQNTLKILESNEKGNTAIICELINDLYQDEIDKVVAMAEEWMPDIQVPECDYSMINPQRV